MVIALGLMIVMATVVNVIFSWFGSIIWDYFGGSNLLAILNNLALVGIIVLANAFIYKVLPDVKLTWRDVWAGAITAALLMVLGGFVVGIYFRLGGVGSAFQAAGAFAVLMISIYYFAQIFLLGAIITRIYAQKVGSQRETA
jgi:membrane protein